MARKNDKTPISILKSAKLEPDVHSWLVLLSEKYDTTLSGVIRKLIVEHEPDVIELQDKIETLKRENL